VAEEAEEAHSQLAERVELVVVVLVCKTRRLMLEQQILAVAGALLPTELLAEQVGLVWLYCVIHLHSQLP
jgi:hypothetical protein